MSAKYNCAEVLTNQGPVSIWKPSFPGMEIPMLKIRRSWDRLIFNMGIPILVRRYLYIETGPRSQLDTPYIDGLALAMEYQ